MSSSQPGILAPIPRVARYQSYSVVPGADAPQALRRLRALDGIDGERAVVGIGAPLAAALHAPVPGLRSFAPHTAPFVAVPATPQGLWVWLRGEDRGEVYHRGRTVDAALGDAFRAEQAIDAFNFDGGRDLTGYEDGTENPKGKAARQAALVSGAGPGLDGGSFVAAQLWLHDFARWDRFTPAQRNAAIGRDRESNEELDDAPESAHVKRTAQESFDPEAFVLRRSMPWSAGAMAGLVFVAFGRSFDAFEALLARMVGEEDGVTDALFTFTRPLTGAYFWCPPMLRGRLDLRALRL